MGWWSKKFSFPVVAHEQAVEPIERGDLLSTGAYMLYTGFDEEFIPCPVDYKVKGGERFGVGDRSFEVFHAPGHTVGSIHVLDGENYFVGDTLFANGGIGWMDVHWGSHPQDYVQSLELMHAHIGKMIYPGHGAPYILKPSIIRKGQKAAAFYISGAHGLGSPRAPSQYASRKNVPSPNKKTIRIAAKLP
jgi:glyoxylase-like metal-dependent hydrolase (beta-lactamase superfamily II)